MKKQLTEEEIIDFICDKIKAYLLNNKMFSNAAILESAQLDLLSPFGAFPLYLRSRDIKEATQYSASHVGALIKQIEKQVPGSVYRSGVKGVRVHRDKFFEWFSKQNGIKIGGTHE